MVGRCCHCGEICIYRCRRLCCACYTNKAIRHLHPTNPKYSNWQGVQDRMALGPLPKEPTNAVPGSSDKILVLQDRAARGEQLFHPDDYEDDSCCYDSF